MFRDVPPRDLARTQTAMLDTMFHAKSIGQLSIKLRAAAAVHVQRLVPEAAFDHWLEALLHALDAVRLGVFTVFRVYCLTHKLTTSSSHFFIDFGTVTKF